METIALVNKPSAYARLPLSPHALSLLSLVVATSASSVARAQTFESNPTGAPPADGKALVTGPKAKDAPTFDAPVDTTTATIAAGGMQTGGNARFLAATDRLGCHIGEKFRLLLA